MTIKQRQHLLAYLGYYVGDIKESWTSDCKIACKAFQNDFGGIAVDGWYGPETDKALTHAVTYGMAKKTYSTGSDPFDGIKHITKHEVACKCNKYCNGHPTEMKRGVLLVVDRTREHFRSPAIVSSGLRCTQHNANVGGVSNSRHLGGKAIDFCIQGKSSTETLAYVQSQPETRYAYAIDSQFVHVDSDIL